VTAPVPDSQESPFDFESAFREYYARVARLIARIVRDPGRAEEIAVEVFYRLWRNRKAQGEKVGGWLYRTAVRAGLYEVRREARRERVAHFFRPSARPASPHEVHESNEDQRRVREVLTKMDPQRAELVLLRSAGLSYAELAAALDLNPASVGTLLGRAQQVFRKEYVKRYGEP